MSGGERLQPRRRLAPLEVVIVMHQKCDVEKSSQFTRQTDKKYGHLGCSLVISILKTKVAELQEKSCKNSAFRGIGCPFPSWGRQHHKIHFLTRSRLEYFASKNFQGFPPDI